jgi:hypothetical protein
VLIGTLFGFWPAIFLAYRSYHPNLLIVVCILVASAINSVVSATFCTATKVIVANTMPRLTMPRQLLFVLFSPRDCSRLNYATEMQKLRNLQNILSLCNGDAEDVHLQTIFLSILSPSGGWVEVEHKLFTEKNTSQKVMNHLPPSTFGRYWMRSISMGRSRRSTKKPSRLASFNLRLV